MGRRTEQKKTRSTSPTRNPPWQRDELILALDLYFRHPPGSISQDHPAVVELSELLDALPIHAERPDGAKFRNPNGVYMKLCNYLRLDPTYKGRGLQRGSRLDEKVWEEFAADRRRLRDLANAIRRGHGAADGNSRDLTDDEEAEFPEGRVLYRLHRDRERKRSVVRAARRRALQKHGRLFCEACGFDFKKSYGETGEGYIECHHTRPLSELSSVGERTRIVDIALLCSNCHRMVHRRRPWLTISQLRQLVG